MTKPNEMKMENKGLKKHHCNKTFKDIIAKM